MQVDIQANLQQKLLVIRKIRPEIRSLGLCYRIATEIFPPSINYLVLIDQSVN